jgi:hypothetical protein
MSRSPRPLLEEEIELLVRHFGIQRVRLAMAKFSPENDRERLSPARRNAPSSRGPARATVATALESIRGSDTARHDLLAEFLTRLNARQVLPESQDIRQFAQLIGLKGIAGKSRRDMIPKLTRSLLELPIERLRTAVESAANISEAQRQMGFSVLTDKLLGRP